MMASALVWCTGMNILTHFRMNPLCSFVLDRHLKAFSSFKQEIDVSLLLWFCPVIFTIIFYNLWTFFPWFGWVRSCLRWMLRQICLWREPASVKAAVALGCFHLLIVNQLYYPLLLVPHKQIVPDEALQLAVSLFE